MPGEFDKRSDFLRFSAQAVGVIAAGLLLSPKVKAMVINDGTLLAVKKETEPQDPSLVLEKGVVYPVIRGSQDKPNYGLTFDDGFKEDAIKRVLEVLKTKKAKATFFVIGVLMEKYPKLWQRAAEEGHEVCNHTFGHGKLPSFSDAEIVNQITSWEKTAVNILGGDYLKMMKSKFNYFRLPDGTGSRDQRVLKIISNCGYRAIGWTAETYSSVQKKYDLNKCDDEKVAVESAEHMIREAGKGIIGLFHFNYWDTVYFDMVIDRIREKGLNPTNVSETI